MRKTIAAIVLALVLLIPFNSVLAQSSAELLQRISLLEQLIALLRQVAALQAQLEQLQGLSPIGGAPVSPTPTTPATPQSGVTDPEQPSFEIELFYRPSPNPEINGGRIIWRPTRYGEPIRDSYWESKPLAVVERAEILVNGKLLRTYLNTRPACTPDGTRDCSSSGVQDWYDYWLPPLSAEDNESIVLRVTMEGETLSINVPVNYQAAE